MEPSHLGGYELFVRWCLLRSGKLALRSRRHSLRRDEPLHLARHHEDFFARAASLIDERKATGLQLQHEVGVLVSQRPRGTGREGGAADALAIEARAECRAELQVLRVLLFEP